MPEEQSRPSAAWIFPPVFLVYAASAYPSIAPRDGCDLALAALHLSPAHPPGYPLYALAGHLWLQALPLGNPAYRLNLLSAAAGAAACCCFFSWARRRCGALASAALTAALALCGPLRKFSVLPEMYSAQALFLCILLALSDGTRETARRRAAASGLALGLGLVNHQTLILFVPALLWLWRGELRRAWPAAAAACAGGFALEAFLALRLASLDLAWRVLTRADYGTLQLFSGLSAPMTPASAARLLGFWGRGAILTLSPLAAGLAAWGAVRAVQGKSDRRAEAASLVIALGFFGPIFFLLTGFDVSTWVSASVLESAFVSTAVVLCALAALGLAAVPQRQLRLFLALATAVWSASLGVLDGRHREDFSAPDYIASLRRLMPPGSAAVVGGDTALFGLRWQDALLPAGMELRSVVEPDAGPWLARQAAVKPAFVLGISAEKLAAMGLSRAPLSPQGLVQRLGAATLDEDSAWSLTALRPSPALDLGESYAHDVRLAYAFAHFLSGLIDEDRGFPTDHHAESAASLDSEDYSLGPAASRALP